MVGGAAANLGISSGKLAVKRAAGWLISDAYAHSSGTTRGEYVIARRQPGQRL
jgi:hypothetical protein